MTDNSPNFVCSKVRQLSRKDQLTVIHLLKSDLRVLGQALLGFVREHEGFWFLRRRHGSAAVVLLRIHDVEIDQDQAMGRDLSLVWDKLVVAWW